MKNISKYKTTIILSTFILLIAISTVVFASEYTVGVSINASKAKEFETPGNTILGIIRVVGTFAAVIALMIIGIKYMLGSVEEKAEYKKTFGVYAIGAILIFGISNLLVVIYPIINNP